MNASVAQIEWLDLAVLVVPVALVVGVLFRWSEGGWNAVYALARMLVQLVLIGYLLVFVFAADAPWIIVLVLSVMLLAAGWISLGPVPGPRRRLLPRVCLALGVGGGFTLATVTWGVLGLDPWYHPQVMVPLAGMVFANSMNTVSLAAERFAAEVSAGGPALGARRVAFRTGMIPVINSLFAVGLVALPGMMTGQILAGVSPLIAARYQIVVMGMLFAASGMSAAIYLALAARDASAAAPGGAQTG